MKSWTVIVLCLALTVLGFGLGWWSKPTPVHQTPVPQVIHDTTETRDTLYLPYVPKPTKPVVTDSSAHSDTASAVLSVVSGLKTVHLDPVIGKAKVSILYDLPTPMYPLGIVRKASVTYPQFTDSVMVPVPYKVEVYKTDLGLLAIVSGSIAVLAFLIGLLV